MSILVFFIFANVIECDFIEIEANHLIPMTIEIE